VRNFDDLLAQIEASTREEVLRLLTDLTPKERKAFGPKFRRMLTHRDTWGPDDHLSLAVVATADGVQQARVFVTHGWVTDQFVEDVTEILAARRPSWLPALVDAILDEPGSANWRVARSIVRAGLAPEPDHPEYFRGTVRGVPDFGAHNRGALVNLLRRDPALVGDHLLRMLSTEGVGRLLAYHDAFVERYLPRQLDVTANPAGTWRVALATLAESGELDRGRLLDTVLAAPLHDWAVADLGWYVSMHEAIEPKLDEIASRQGTYARLLTVEHGPSVRVAQRAFDSLVGDERFAFEPFLAASHATLGRSDKASVKAHLRLLERVAGTHHEVAIADVVRIACHHPAVDVRDHAASLLSRRGVEVAPAARPVPLRQTQPEPRPPAPSVRPIESADELAEVLLGLVEEVDPLEMERAIDGVLRLADQCPTTAAVLLARARGAEYDGSGPRIAARILSVAWLTPRTRQGDRDWQSFRGDRMFGVDGGVPETFVAAIRHRIWCVADAVRAGPHPSLAFPSRTDFSLDAAELTARLRAARRRPVLELELVVALLRVPPGDRAAVELPRSIPSSDAVARVQHGRPLSWRRRLVRYHRAASEQVRRGVVFGAETGGTETGGRGHSAAGILARSHPELTLTGEASYGEDDPRFEQTLELGATLLPHDHDVLAAHAHPYLLRDLEKDRACSVLVVDAIARATTANGPPASSALVLALAAKDARGRTAAQDAIIDLARYGVLDGADLGRQAALLLRDDLVVGRRISAGLAECARASDAAVPPLLDALQEIVGVLPGRRDAAAFLDLTADLAERAGRRIDLPVEFHELAAGRSSSLAAKAARRLLG
jgi:hypothetical protein